MAGSLPWGRPRRSARPRPAPTMVRLGGATVIPGLIDAHCHVADIGYLAAAADCGQPSAPDIARDSGAAQAGRRTDS